MTDILPLLDHPTTTAALVMARRWYKGRNIGGGADALVHAVEVASQLRWYIVDVAPDVVAAALLHDSPDLAPSCIDLDAALADISPEGARLVRALQHEHDGLAAGTIPAPPQHDLPLMQASTADKIVSIQLVLNRAPTTPSTPPPTGPVAAPSPQPCPTSAPSTTPPNGSCR